MPLSVMYQDPAANAVDLWKWILHVTELSTAEQERFLIPVDISHLEW